MDSWLENDLRRIENDVESPFENMSEDERLQYAMLLSQKPQQNFHPPPSPPQHKHSATNTTQGLTGSELLRRVKAAASEAEN